MNQLINSIQYIIQIIIFMMIISIFRHLGSHKNKNQKKSSFVLLDFHFIIS